MKEYERLTCVIDGEARVMETKFESKWAMQKAVDRLAEIEDKIEQGALIELSVVAELIREFVGDDCPCNFNDIDEWLPYVCEFADTTCPDGKCWEQYLKTKLKELRGEEE